MTPRRLPLLGALTLLGLGLTASSPLAQPGQLLTVPVSFGRGLNTAQPGNAVNHAILPDDIHVKEGGVVQFMVAGLHQVTVYNPGTTPEDIVIPAGNPFFIDDATNRFYLGITPAGGPPGTPVTTDPSNAMNRIESVTLGERGTYLVICNVRQHFQDGMFAFVRVTP
jgi:plastocyanin